MRLRPLLYLGMALGLFACLSVAQLSESSVELDRGTVAYKAARYEEAVGHFRHAVTLDPDNPRAHMLLATAYTQQYIPGADEPSNLEMAKHATAEFDEVLR